MPRTVGCSLCLVSGSRYQVSVCSAQCRTGGAYPRTRKVRKHVQQAAGTAAVLSGRMISTAVESRYRYAHAAVLGATVAVQETQNGRSVDRLRR